MEFFTIGVYNSTENDYFSKIHENKIDTFCDIRQRRGVRGSKYAFVNSKKLQERLLVIKCRYLHVLDLAPTTMIRKLQKEADLNQGNKKRDRSKLSSLFSSTYREQVIGNFDFQSFINSLEENKSKRIVFFCVEENSEACHRSIVTEALEQLGFNITHL